MDLTNHAYRYMMILSVGEKPIFLLPSSSTLPNQDKKRFQEKPTCGFLLRALLDVSIKPDQVMFLSAADPVVSRCATFASELTIP
ncbi:hypothetical protein [Deinococcus misasensis]|uniref:hypothetical protein n=1 Tax=Deinococcus misasensis TaxID=392413 RepID=UPI0012F9735B|nr:hypothetical protein [Deinococcus misasensis]